MKRDTFVRRRLFACLLLMIIIGGNLSTIMAAPGDGPQSIEDIASRPLNTAAPAVTATPVETHVPVATAAPTHTNAAADTKAPAAAAQTNTDSQIIDIISGSTDMSTTDERLVAVSKPIVKLFGMITQAICLLTTVGLGLSVAIDLLYITVPFTRSILSNGHVGNSMANAGVSSITSAPTHVGIPGQAQVQQAQVQQANSASRNDGGAIGRIQWVSGPALNAVASESTVGTDGKVHSPLTVYMKNAMFKLIAVPVLIVVLLTGSAQNIGFVIGTALGNIQFSV